MTDTLSLDTLAGAEAAFKAAAARLEDNTATPDVVSRVEKIIVKATRQHAGWSKLTIDALLVLGLYLLRNPYRGMGKGGRPSKTVRADSLPTLAERGVKNRRIAWRALRVARISEADWNAYKASGGTSESGLHEFVKGRALKRVVARSISCSGLRASANARSASSTVIRDWLTVRLPRRWSLQIRYRYAC